MELRFTGRQHKGSLWTIVTKHHNLQIIKDFSSTHMQLYENLIQVTKLYVPKIDCPLPIAHDSVTYSKQIWHGFSSKIINSATVNHFSDIFSNQKRVVIELQELQLQSQSIFILLLIILLLLFAKQLSNLIIRYCRQSSQLSFLNSLNIALCDM